MTIKEALSSSLLKLQISESEIDRALIEAGVSGESDYATNLTLAGTAEYNLLTTIYVESISQADYTIKYNTKGIEARLSFLANKLGLDNPTATAGPTITNISYKW